MADSTLSQEQLKEREERFRYVDLTHPLMKALFEMQLNLDALQEEQS